MRRFVCIIFTAIGILAVGGCKTPSLTQISAFGTASVSLAEHSKKGYALVDSSTIDRKMYDVASNTKLGPTDSTFQGVFTGAQADDLAIRLMLLENLGSYADALRKLATADFRKDIDEASKDLQGALVGLSRRYEKVSGKSSPIGEQNFRFVAAAVDAIGGAIVESKRRQAIKEIILSADDVVQNASKLLTDELGEGSLLAELVHQNLMNADGSLRQAYNKNARVKEVTFDARYQMLTRIRQMHEAAEAVPDFFKNVSEGSAKIGQTHAALKKAVMKGKFTSAEIARSIGELMNYSKSVKSFYESLESNNNSKGSIP